MNGLPSYADIAGDGTSQHDGGNKTTSKAILQSQIELEAILKNVTD